MRIAAKSCLLSPPTAGRFLARNDVRMRCPTRPALSLMLLVLVVACSAGPEPGAPADMETTAAVSEELVVGGCQCVSSGSCAQASYADVPANGKYVITTFGGGSDTHAMACGGVADASWAYVAGSARFSCGTKLLVEAGGKHCVAQVADCGPNRCVEQAASGSCGTHTPVLNSSPFITKYLLGQSAAGWSEHKVVSAGILDSSSTVGCPGKPVSVSTGGGGGSGSGSGAACTAPSCVGCGDCNSQCLCEVGNPVLCGAVCGAGSGGSGAGGTGGSGNAGGSGNTGNTGGGSAGSAGAAGSDLKGDVGDEGKCEYPACNGCEGCDDQCLCEGNDAATCAQLCSTGQAGVCAAPECSSCASCHDACSCNGLAPSTCINLCGEPIADPQIAATGPRPAPPENCGASSFVGVRAGSRAAAAWPYFALLAFAFARRRRTQRQAVS